MYRREKFERNWAETQIGKRMGPVIRDDPADPRLNFLSRLPFSSLVYDNEKTGYIRGDVVDVSKDVIQLKYEIVLMLVSTIFG